MGRFRKAAGGAGSSTEWDMTTIAPKKVLMEHATWRPRFSRSIAVGMAMLVITTIALGHSVGRFSDHAVNQDPERRDDFPHV